jgi:hypothetical protein
MALTLLVPSSGTIGFPHASIVERTEKIPRREFQPNGRLSLHG